MMKVYKFGMLVASVGLVFGLMTGCGGGGGTDSIIPLAETDSSTPSTEIEDNVFVQQNEYAQQSVPDSYALFKAVNEELELLTNALGEGWEYTEWTEDDIQSMLSEDEIEQLVSKLAVIYNDKVVPSAEAVELSLNGLSNTEQEIQNLLNISDGTYKIIAAAPLVIPVFEISAAILTAFVSYGLAVAHEFKTREASNEDKTETEVLVEEANTNAKAYNDVTEGGKAGSISLLESAITFGLSNIAAANEWWKLQFIVDKGSNAKTVSDIAVGVKKCYPEDTPPQKQVDFILNALDADVDGDGEITYAGKSDDEGVFHNIPEGDWTFVVFSEGNVRSASGCIDISGDEDLITENITVTPISEYEDLIDDGDEVLPDPTTDSSNIQVTIPGYTPPFVSNYTEMNFASLNDGPYIYPSFLSTDANSPEEVNYESDIFFMKFNTTLSAGNTYLLTEEGDGNANLRFTTGQIVDEDGAPIVFSEVSGSFTLTEYGTNVGDRLSGSFSCDVVGKRSEDVVINGNISGTFSGTLSATEINSAVSKSMTVSF